MAAAKTGYRALFSSHLNSLAAHLNLIRQTSCEILLSAAGVDVSDILEVEPMKHVVVPEADALFTGASTKRFPFPKSFEDAKLDEYVVIHTSGTTGLPKPIYMNHAFTAALDAQFALPDIDPATGFRREMTCRIYEGALLAPFAPFHGICATYLFALSVFANTTLVFGHPDRLLTLSDMVHMLKNIELVAAFVPPHVLEQFVETTQCLPELAKLRVVHYGGGILRPQAADALISQGVRLANYWGTSEIGVVVHGALQPQDWEYLSFDPIYNGMEFRLAQSADTEGRRGKEIYEQVIVRRPEALPYTMVFARRPDVKEWNVGDLWEKHPTEPHTWRYYGRADDLICFSNGLKLHPVDIENKLNSHKFIQSTVLEGTEHLQVVALVELNEGGNEALSRLGAEAVKDDIWHLIQDINKESQKIGQISKDHLLLASREKPLPRASKGTVQRRAAVQEYQKEINDVYARHGDELPQDLMDRLKLNGA